MFTCELCEEGFCPEMGEIKLFVLVDPRESLREIVAHKECALEECRSEGLDILTERKLNS